MPESLNFGDLGNYGVSNEIQKDLEVNIGEVGGHGSKESERRSNRDRDSA